MNSTIRDRNFLIFLLAQTLGGFGDSCLWLAMGVWVKSITGSSSAAGMLFFAFAVPQLSGPFAGYIVDKVRLKRLLISVNLGTAAAVLSVLLVHGRSDIWIIYAVMAVSGAATTVQGPAQSALLTVMVPQEHLVTGNSALQTVRQGIRLIAPVIGAALFAWGGAHTVVALDILILVLSATLLSFLALPQSRPGSDAALDMASLTAGIRHIYRTRLLLRTVASTTAVLTVVGFSETLVYAITDRGLHRPPDFVGILMAAQGAGAILGSVVAPAFARRWSDVSLAGSGILLFSLSSAAFMSSSVTIVLIGAAVFGQSLSWILIGLYAVMQRNTPAEIQGRVFSAADFLTTLPQTGAIAVGAFLITVVGYRSLLAIMASASLASGAYLMSGSQTAGDPVKSDLDARLTAAIPDE